MSHSGEKGRCMLEQQAKPPGPDLQANSPESLEVINDTPNAFLHFAQHYGDIVNVSVGSQTLFLLNHPDDVRDLLVRYQQNTVKPVERTNGAPFLGNGLMRSEKDTHQDKRRRLQPLFYRQHLSHYDAITTKITQEASRNWHHGTTVDMSHEMMHVTLRILGQILFGTDIEQEATDLTHGLLTIMRMTQQNHTRTVVIGNRALEAANLQQRREREIALSHLFPTFDAVIQARRTAGFQGDDILSTLLRINPGPSEAQAGNPHHLPFSDQQLREEMVTLLLAGHESLAHALIWSWYLFAQHPTVTKIIRAELQAVLGDRLPTSQDLDQLRYLRQAICEVLRLYPPVWTIARTLQEPYLVQGYCLPKNATVIMSQWAIHRDSRWYPAPETFDLRRWTPAEIAKRPKFAYFPFGGGPRLCLGESFVWMQVALILATFLKTWSAALPFGEVPIEASVTLRPKGGLPMLLQQER